MEVEEFVTNVLRQLENSIAAATKQSADKDFHFERSVDFDLAITYSANKEGGGGGKLKAGIKVVDFEIGGGGKISTGQQVVQRIRFSVNIWDKDKSNGSAVVEQGTTSMFDPNIQF
jgi:hypothetical protein